MEDISLREVKEILEEVTCKLLEKEETYLRLVQDAQRWTELSQVIAELRTPVRELRQATERIVAKVETLVDQVQLRDILEQSQMEQARVFNETLRQNHVFMNQLAQDINQSLKEIVAMNGVLVQKLSGYVVQSVREQGLEQRWEQRFRLLFITVVVGLVGTTLLQLWAFYRSPWMSPRYLQVMERLYQRLVR